MTEPEAVIWGVRAGETGQADNLFLKKNCIAIGWTRMGDLSSLPSDREVIKGKLAAAYPDRKPMGVALEAGMLLRFLHEMKPGDIVVYPSKKDRQIHLGIVEGGYTFDPARDQDYPHQRPVKWRRAVPRTKFTQGALYEIGAASRSR